MLKKIFLGLLFITYSNFVFPQFMEYQNPRVYKVADISITGVKFLDEDILKDLSGIKIGEKITVPGNEITEAIKKYWKQGLFSDIKITADSIVNDKIYLNIYLSERRRLSSYTIEGVKKSEKKDIEEMIELKEGNQITENVLNNVENSIHRYFIDKGHLDVTVDFIRKQDPNLPNKVYLKIIVDKGERIKIKDIVFVGNEKFKDSRLERVFKKTREKQLRFLFNASKLIREEYKKDKQSLIDFYNQRGYRDARIISDSLAYVSDKRIKLFVNIEEGDKYYFGDISWIGNTVYSTELLNKRLGINKGDVYDKELLNKRLYIDEDAVTSIYLDNGYLFSNIDPVEVNVESDSIDLEMRVYEGKQATIDRVIIQGNTKTNEHVVRRELRTLPGDLFSKSDIVRSVRELSQLGHFDPEKIMPNPIPNQADGTVDIKYDLTEKSNDQLEISGGWGAGMIIGTIGLRFNNFSARNLLNLDAWRPIPSGDGQTLSIRAQTNGSYYQAYNMTFVEPWFGGKKPNSLSFSIYHTIRNSGSYWDRDDDAPEQFMKTTGASLGLGQRLKWPDDYFTLYNEVSYQRYHLKDFGTYFLFSSGISNNISFTTKFGRNSIDQPIYPRKGAEIYLSLQLTPPYSLIDGRDYSLMTDQEKYRYIEYHKWKFKASWFKGIDKSKYNNPKLVLHTKFEFAYLAHYNDDIGPSPFEGFDLGGDGLSGYNLYGRETIALRGYQNGSLTPTIDGRKSGNIYDKFTLELRYPIVLKTSVTLFGLGFFEAGNAWYSAADFNPYEMHRSLGVGMRAFLPMFGLLGVDWGYGFDEVPGWPDAHRGQFHFVIGQQF